MAGVGESNGRGSLSKCCLHHQHVGAASHSVIVAKHGVKFFCVPRGPWGARQPAILSSNMRARHVHRSRLADTLTWIGSCINDDAPSKQALIIRCSMPTKLDLLLSMLQSYEYWSNIMLCTTGPRLGILLHLSEQSGIRMYIESERKWAR